LISFECPANIPATTYTIEIDNLRNPESVAITDTMGVMTLMKYTGDIDYSVIDIATALPTNFVATKGKIDTITTVSITKD
jgi:hypothetical protein